MWFLEREDKQMNSMHHLYNLCPKIVEKLFSDKRNTIKNVLDERTYIINHEASYSGDMLRIQEKVSSKMILFPCKILVFWISMSSQGHISKTHWCAN